MKIDGAERWTSKWQPRSQQISSLANWQTLLNKERTAIKILRLYMKNKVKMKNNYLNILTFIENGKSENPNCPCFTLSSVKQKCYRRIVQPRKQVTPLPRLTETYSQEEQGIGNLASNYLFMRLSSGWVQRKGQRILFQPKCLARGFILGAAPLNKWPLVILAL